MKRYIQNQIDDLSSMIDILVYEEISEKIHHLRNLAKKNNLHDYFQDEFFGLEMMLWEKTKQ